jgi:radical SAM superfamily enzyme YgiQ (UPF0313 family)
MKLRVVILKPSKYGADGYVERWRRGFMPNSTVPHLRSMTPAAVRGAAVEVHAVDEYVQTDLRYLSLLGAERGVRTLVALVGVQSHQFQRALDLAAFAAARGASAVLGGPHPMTCDTEVFHGRGVSFALCEAERVWPQILSDALGGSLRPVYGAERRWQEALDAPVLVPPPRRDLRRYAVAMLGVYPARGCPYSCNFCSVIKIAGREVRSQPVETTLESLRRAGRAGVRFIMFTSDNFNKYPEAAALLEGMIAEKLRLPFFAQCDAQIVRQPELVSLMARAGCFQIFVGVESFNPATLRGAHKFHNAPERYGEILALCRDHGISAHFSNILGFPEDTEEGIAEHLGALSRLDPDLASFYILCPIPGTEQYDEFLSSGRITDGNLDRFDGLRLVWRHPRLSAETLNRLLLRCYRSFYAPSAVARRVARLSRGKRDFRRRAALFATIGAAVQARVAVRRGLHPMAGGLWQVRRDSAEDYRALRRRTLGIDRAPLPASLALPAADSALNRAAKLRV